MSELKIKVQIKRLPGNSDLPFPTYQSVEAVGMDIAAAVVGEMIIRPGETASIPCGFSVAIPEGHEGQIRPRSGLAAECGITVANSPGTIDPDYRGEVKVLLINHGKKEFAIRRGMRIAQMLVLPVPRVQWQEAQELSPTQRDSGGFGHTGE